MDVAELPENAPRYVVLSYELNHADGRKSFPLVLVNWAPPSCEMSLLTLHASGLLDFQNTVRRNPVCAVATVLITVLVFRPMSARSSRSETEQKG